MKVTHYKQYSITTSHDGKKTLYHISIPKNHVINKFDIATYYHGSIAIILWDQCYNTIICSPRMKMDFFTCMDAGIKKMLDFFDVIERKYGKRYIFQVSSGGLDINGYDLDNYYRSNKISHFLTSQIHHGNNKLHFKSYYLLLDHEDDALMHKLKFG